MGLTQKHLIEQQIPAHIREASPLFTKFLQYYYEFHEQMGLDKAIQDILSYNNVDTAEESFVRQFFEELQILPHSIVADRKLVAQHIYDLYEAKGSERAIKLLFQIVFGEQVSVSYPSEQILRASDGKWIRDSFLTLQTLEGEITDASNRIVFTGSRGMFSFAIKSYESLGAAITRVAFNTNQPFFVDGVARVFIYTNDQLDFTGQIVNMPSRIQIEDGGAAWQLGQVIVLPGSVKDTIVQVKRVSSGGVIEKLDVIQFGHGYIADPVFVISPYKYKPTSSYVEQYSEKLTDVPLSYAHTINIFDLMEGIGENVLGLDSNQEYVLEGYVLQDYINRRSIVQTIYVDGNTGVQNDEITIQQWLDSRARIRIVNDATATSAGYYQNNDGKISVPDIRLQDSYFYQIFSYVIETAQSLKTYGSVLNKIHPAGFKYFSNLAKTADIIVDVDSSRILSRDNALFIDGLIARDDPTQFTKTMNIALIDDQLITDIDVANNYDANNELMYFDGSIDGDWDLIEAATNQPYDAQNYDAQSYGESGDVDQYTREDEAVTIQKN